MNTFKTAVVLATLLGVGYGVHVVLNKPLSSNYANNSYQQTQTPLDEFGLPRLDIEGVQGFAAEATAGNGQFQTPRILPGNSADNYQNRAASAPQNGNPNFTDQVDNFVANGAVNTADDRTSAQAADQLTGTDVSTSSGGDQGVNALPDLSLNSADFPELPEIQADSTSYPDDPQQFAEQPTWTPPAQQVPYANPQTAASSTAITRESPAGAHANGLAQSTLIDDSTAATSTAVSTQLVAPPSSRNGSTAFANSAFNNMWQSAQEKVTDGEYDVALFTLSLWYSNPELTSEQRNVLIPLLDELAGKVIYSRDYVFGRPHTVQPQETLAQIAAQNAVTPEFLARVNGLDTSSVLSPGQQLKVVTGPFRAELNLSNREITVFVGSYYAGRFMAGVGRDLPLGEMALKVFEKSGARPYVDRDTNEQTVAGDPKNPYGNYWIGLRIPGATVNPYLGIHSTGSRVEASDTRGCISVSDRDADDLQAILSSGSLFTVRR